MKKNYFRELVGTMLLVYTWLSPIFSQQEIPVLRLNTNMHTGRINRISVDQSGTLLLTVSADKTAKLWESKTGKLIRTIHVPIGNELEGILYAGAISPNGNIIAVGGWTGYDWDGTYSVYLIGTSSGTMTGRVTGFKEVITNVLFSYTGEFFYVFLGNGQIFKYETIGIKQLGMSKRLSSGIIDAASCNQDNMAVLSEDGKLTVFDKNLDVIMQNSSNTNASSIAYSQDGETIALTYNNNSMVGFYDATEKKLPLIKMLKPEGQPADMIGGLLSCVFTPDADGFIAGGSLFLDLHQNRISHIRCWNYQSKNQFTDYPRLQNSVTDLITIDNHTVIYAGSYPDFGCMSLDGNEAYYKSAETMDFRPVAVNSPTKGPYGASLKIGVTGETVEFKSFSGSPMVFSNKSKSYLEKLDRSFSPKDQYFNLIKITNYQQSFEPKLNGKKLNFLKDRERSLAVDISNNNPMIVFGCDRNIYCLDAKGEVVWEKPVQSPAYQVIFSGDGKLVVTATGDGLLHWYKAINGELILSMYAHPDGKRWIVWTPEGYFDAQENSLELLGWHINKGKDKVAEFYPVSQFFDQYFIPGIADKVISGLDFKSTLQAGNSINQLKKPPLTEIINPVTESKSNNKEVVVNVRVTDQGGGIDEIRLYHNGKLIEGTSRGFRPASGSAGVVLNNYNVSLVSGENRIRASAYSTQRVEAKSEEIVIWYNAGQNRGNLYILAVGINQYKNPKYSLNYAVEDAQAFTQALSTGASSLFQTVESQLVINQQATFKGIAEAFSPLIEKVQPEDVFVFYYGGHGVMSSGNETERPAYYFVPYDVTKMYEADDMLKNLALSSDQLIEFSKKIKAQKQLFILDACQSGGALQDMAFRGAAEEKAIAQLARSTGTYFIAASGSEQFAAEVAELGHGVFTYSVIEALNGLCNFNENQVTVSLLKTCVENRVPELTEKYRGQAQFPTGYGFGQDFPITLVKVK